MSRGILIFILLLFCSGYTMAKSFEFSTEEFQLGRWSRKSLSFEQGMRKISLLDQWYDRLPADQKKSYHDEYTVNRNRLFLVTQEKYFEQKMNEPTSPQDLVLDRFQPSWIAAEREVNRKDSIARYRELKEINDDVLESDSALKTDFPISLNGLNQIESTSPKVRALTAELSRSFSKGNQGNEQSMRGTAEISFQFDFGRLKSKIENSTDWLENRCHEGFRDFNLMNPESRGDFEKKKTEFLKALGVKNEVSSSISKDLSSWYSEPQSQWFEGFSNNQCVGYAVSSDVSAVANKTNLVNRALSPHHAYAQVYVFAKEEIQRKKERGTLSQEEVAILEFAEKVPSLKTDHVEFCNPVHYNVNPMLGSPLIDDSLTYVFRGFQKKALCGSMEINRKQIGKDTPLYTVEDFVAMEFKTANDQGLDFDFFKMLIDAGHPPVVLLDTDKNSSEFNGWMKIQSNSGLQHPVNVVGYGEEINPITLCKEPYFKIRNSRGTKKTHYKVSARNLLSHIIGVYKVKSVKKAD